MPAEQQPQKPVALENGRVPAEPAQMAQQLCGRIPPDSEGQLVNFGRIPNELSNKLLTRPAISAHSTAQSVGNSPQSVANAEKTSVEKVAQNVISHISRKASH